MERKSSALLRRPAVKAKTGLSTSSIYAKMARDEFPKPIRLGPKSVAWIEDEVDAWIAARVAASRQGEAA
ncbi:helix-turn-helix transcriptional regulator [Rhodospira trueperi]|uniref:Prophage regulatory protein n=1 Tax=Rhodospira trueperi TaxID=69960 RepID=A0A1G6X2S4_9PROT|nr:AlpA family transcriptional regulator [Rhodospira trueperi]SDD72482.1 prophage regulatory protein [Rhodospira trueperi]